MKSGDKTRTMVLRSVLAEISRYEVETDVRRQADESAVVQILKRERARREEALEFARRAARQDLIEQNEAEIRILDGYIPAAPAAEEVGAIVSGLIGGGASQIGPIMKALRARFGARLDAKMASEMVKQALAKKS